MLILLKLQNTFNLKEIHEKPDMLSAALYLQVSIISQALIFVTRSRSWSFVERPGVMLVGAFLVAQLVSIKPHLVGFVCYRDGCFACSNFLTLGQSSLPPLSRCMQNGNLLGLKALAGDGREPSGFSASLLTSLWILSSS